ncbi:ARID DNA-binding domain-containing protein [Tanacetum coccineum]
MLSLFNCHINVEVCSSIVPVKYAFKYVYKGHDKQVIHLSSDNAKPVINEIKRYQDAYYISPPEAMWRIYGFSLANMNPVVFPLQVHLPNQQQVRFVDDADLTQIIERERDKRSIIRLLEYGLYSKKTARGQLVSAHPAKGEQFCLRILLQHVPRPTGFYFLYTVNGVLYSTFQKAALVRGLIENDESLSLCLSEATLFSFSPTLRRLFATILTFYSLGDVRKLWDDHYEALSEDYRYRTYLYNDLLAEVCSYGSVALATTSSGAAANNVPASMAKRHAIEAVDCTMQDIIGDSRVFGGKVMVIGGDFHQITRDCKKMLQRKIEEFEAFNSSLPVNKYMNYNCFYCNQNGHIMKTCPTKIKNDAAHTQNISGGIMEGNKINPTQFEFTSDKSKILCFKCRQYGHFANKCPPEKQDHPKVSLKYPEFIHFQTKGIIKGTDKDSWDNFWYVSITSDKHLTSDLKFFSNFKEEFLVEKLEGQGNFLFTYGMGEVLIKDGSNGYLIPGVHFAPEITINILSINLLKQQGLDIIFEGDKCTIEYMFKNQQGQNMDEDKMRQRHNDYLDDYFESLNKEKTDKKEEIPRFMEDTNASEVHTFQEFVAFLNLIKNDDVISKGWDIYRERFDKVLKWFFNHYLKRPLPGSIPPIIHGVPIHLFDLYKLIDCMGGYLNVHFGQEFGALAEILGLTRSDGEEIKKCYINYLDVFISYYKTARAPEHPIKGGEDSSLEEHQWNIGEKGAQIAVEKGKEKLEHFGIKLEEEDSKQQQIAYYGNSQITCYKCQDFGHYAFECPTKNKGKDQIKNSSYKEPSTSRFSEEDSHNTSISGLPQHKLLLKKGCPIMLLQNIDPANGLCNGTRMVCRSFDDNVIDAEITVGQHAGKRVFLPRIPLTPSKDEQFPFRFKRKQFPVRLSFAMTINKSQDQTIPNVGIYLPESVFSHGQLYAALSRGVSQSTTKILVKLERKFNSHGVYTSNVVYREVLNDV